MKITFATIVFCLALADIPDVHADDLKLVILHNNDIHGRFEETERNSATCKDSHKNVSCIGGFARTAYEIRRHRQLAAEGTGPPVLFLNAGDIYVGTAWFSVFTWNISAVFLNALEPDAISLGNHEFDLGVSGLVPFVERINAPILAANLNFTNEPTLNKVQRSTILEVSGRKIGIIGYLTPETTKISVPGGTIFSDEVEEITKESEYLDSQGVKIIIALGHSGYLIDKTIAEKVPLVDVVIGGHTNTFLWNGAQPDAEEVEDPYPKVITQASGKKVPVVQAYAYTKYLGKLNVTFDDNGELTEFAGQPIFLDSSVPQEEDILQLLEVYRPKIVELNEEVVGKSKVILDASDTSCRFKECNFGNLITDAFVMYVASVSSETWTQAPIGIYNGGGIRTTINPFNTGGNVTRGELLAAIPFGSTVIVLTLKGSDLIQMLEQGIRGNGETSYGEFLQVSGLRIVYDRSKPPMSRVVSVKARCGTCNIPVYTDVQNDQNYTLVANSFLVDGGDGHTVLQENSFDKMTQDLVDVDTVAWYIQKYSPVYPEVQGRITFVESSNEDNDDDNNGNDNNDDNDDNGNDNNNDDDDNGPGSGSRIKINVLLQAITVLSVMICYWVNLN